jgi:hypothetical protein
MTFDKALAKRGVFRNRPRLWVNRKDGLLSDP